jgi:hypothetical protein
MGALLIETCIDAAYSVNTAHTQSYVKKMKTQTDLRSVLRVLLQP